MKKLYAIDVHVTTGVCLRIEADSADEAESIAEAKVIAAVMDGGMPALVRMGFDYSEEIETHCSGEADENGEIEYY